MPIPKLRPRAVKPPPKEEKVLTPEKRKAIEDACARHDLEFLRESFASNNPAVSEYAERFLEKVVEQMRSERDRNDAFFIKQKISSEEPEPERTDTEIKTEN